MPEIVPLNLDAPVTCEQYIRAIESLLPELERISINEGWCSQRHRYFAAVLPEYKTIEDKYGSVIDGTFSFDSVPAENDADFAARLRSVRGRVLWYVKDEVIRLGTANQMLTALGLPEYEINTASIQFDVRLGALRLSVAGSNFYESAEWLRNELPSLLVRALNGQPQPNDNRYVPGSAMIDPVRGVQQSRGSTIPDADTERPDYY
jgi:hypothetical protein